jgi:hypothetical protein
MEETCVLVVDCPGSGSTALTIGRRLATMAQSVACLPLDKAHIVDTVYGSAALMPMADNARYGMWMTQSGLVARPVNDQAAQAVGNWK